LNLSAHASATRQKYNRDWVLGWAWIWRIHFAHLSSSFQRGERVRNLA